ncbi:MAG: pyridoxal-phosphate-dependent aminotransferase family protein, partial [Bacteroidota bacterium]
DASALQREISDKLRQLMFTRNRIVLSTSSGTGLMEGAIRSMTRKRAIVFAVGAFGKRWHELAVLNGIDADLHLEESGNPTLPETVDRYLKSGKYDVATVTHNETSTGIMNPVEAISEVMSKYPDVVWMVDTVSSLGGAKIEVDRNGIDVCISSSQKALALPPGLALASVSEKAVARCKEIGQRGYYLDIGNLVKYVDEKDHQYACTPSLSHMFAMDYQLDRIIKEGIESRFIRHMEMAEFMINWASHFFETYPMPGFESLTVTCIRNTRKVDVKHLNEELGKRGMQLSNGYGDLKDLTFRVAHMGELTLDDMAEVTQAMEEILGLQ